MPGLRKFRLIEHDFFSRKNALFDLFLRKNALGLLFVFSTKFILWLFVFFCEKIRYLIFFQAKLIFWPFFVRKIHLLREFSNLNAVRIIGCPNDWSPDKWSSTVFYLFSVKYVQFYRTIYEEWFGLNGWDISCER